MKNELLVKLINKINFDYANHFELAEAKELSFVPINMQGDAFFVAVSATSDKAKVAEYIKSVFDSRIEFIFLSETNFNVLFDEFLKIFNSKYGNVQLNATADNLSSLDALPDQGVVTPAVVQNEEVHDFDSLNIDSSSVELDGLDDIDVSMNPDAPVAKAATAVQAKPVEAVKSAPVKKVVQPKPLGDDIDLTIDDGDD